MARARSRLRGHEVGAAYERGLELLVLLLQVQPVFVKLFNSRLTRARQSVVVRLLVSSLALMTVEKASICLVVGHA